MATDLTALSPLLSVHGSHPVLVDAGDGPCLVYRDLDAPGGRVVMCGSSGGALTAISAEGAECADFDAVSAEGRIEAVWSEMVDGTFQLMSGGPDAPRQQLTGGANPAIHPRLCATVDGMVWLVYQQVDERGVYRILSRCCTDGRWHEPVPMSDVPGNNWCPAVATCADGRVAVAWDGYAAGSYDVYLRFIEVDGSLSPTVRLTDDNCFHAHVSLAPASNGGVWVGWDRGTSDWGKDNEPYRRGRIFEYNYLHARRFLELRRIDGDRVLPVWPDLQRDVLDMSLPGQHHERPRLFSTTDGLLYVAFRYNQGEPGGGHRTEKRWQAMVTCYDGSEWTSCSELDEAYGLSTGGISVCEDRNGAVLMAAAGEGGGRGTKDLTTRTMLCRTKSFADSASPWDPPVELQAYSVPARPARPERHTISHHDQELGLFFGDVHRHTEFSFCRTSIDGSLEEAFRYARDAADMDFAMTADHDHQEQAPDMWLEVMQAADRFNVPGRFSAFFGYEWIGSNRNRRHRNIVSAERIPPPPFDYVGEGDEKHRDVRKLWAALPRGTAITIPHHTMCNMSLRWGVDPGEGVDPEMEPLVEIFQASRGSSEYAVPPTLWNHFATSGQFRSSFAIEEGAVSVALEQGTRMGFISSSDHMSTHQSYACVYAAENTREALMEAMMARRTYAASDRIVCEFRMGDAFMGEEVRVGDEPLDLHIRFVGTRAIREATLLRDSEPYRTWSPDATEIVIRDLLPASECRGHYFYVRMIQQDTNLAWSSPIWID